MVATLDDMGHRGEDVSATHGDWGRQTPWQPSSGAGPGNNGAWDGGSRSYAEENYPPADGGYGYGPDGGYPGQGQPYPGPGQQGYAPQHGQYGNTYEQQEYGQGRYQQEPYGQEPYGQEPYGQEPYGQHYEQQSYDDQYSGYGPGPGQAGGAGYGGPQQYQPHDDYGYEHRPNPPAGYGPAGYDQRPVSGYAPGGGYQDPSGGYGQPPAYPAPLAGTGAYPSPPAGTGAYPSSPAGTGAYPSSPAGTGAYPSPSAGSGSYPAPHGGRLALPSGQGIYSAEDAGNDWYRGQPAAANGASFADTGTYRLNGRVIDEYGTGPRGALRDPVRGYPPEPDQQGTGQLPVPGLQASGPQAFSRTGAQGVAETRQQLRLDDGAGYPEPGYPEYGQDEPGSRPGRGGSGSFQAPGARNGFGGGGGYGDSEDESSSDGDPYQDRSDDGDSPKKPGGAGRGKKPASGGRTALGPLEGRHLLFAALAVVAVGIIGVAVYVFLFKSSSPSSNLNVQGPLTGSAAPSQVACAQQLGTYCHIQAATDDPTPLTTAELYPPAFTNEKDKASYSLVSTKLDTKCANAVIGQDLIKALQAGNCTQVVRASYVSGDNKIMGTIGVINLSTTNEAHYAGKVVGQNDFIAPLTSAKGVASKLGNGTGVVEAEFKGHYLILTWSEFVNGTNPTTKAEASQLEQFSNDLVAGTANIDLSQRMVTGSAATPAASATK
jgi:hypothetical protein